MLAGQGIDRSCFVTETTAFDDTPIQHFGNVVDIAVPVNVRAIIDFVPDLHLEGISDATGYQNFHHGLHAVSVA